jgi:hypothetical protein
LSSFSTSLSKSSSSSSFDERLKPDFLLVDIFLVAGFFAEFFVCGDREHAELSSSLYSWRLLLLLLVLDAGRLVEDVFLDPGTEEAELSSSLS